MDTQGTLFTTKKKLTFKSDGDFVAKVDSDSVTADQVVAKGITIGAGATFTLSDVGTATMQIGTTFILLNNTSTGPITGTFAGLPEGAQITTEHYIWTGSYQGGDGNDFSGEVLDTL